MASLLEIKRYDERHDCFRLSAGSCLEIVRIICSDFQAIRENDLEYENLKFEQFYSRYPSDIKLVCVNMSERCTKQIQFVNHKLELCQDPICRAELRARRKELEWLEKNRQRKEYYLLLYADSPEQLADARGGAIGRMMDVRLILPIDRQEKIEVLTKILNPEQRYFNKFQMGNVKLAEKYEYDPYLLSAIQPAG